MEKTPRAVEITDKMIEAGRNELMGFDEELFLDGLNEKVQDIFLAMYSAMLEGDDPK